MTNTVLNTKIGKVEKKTDVGGLVNTTVLNAKIAEVENKIPDFSDLVKKTDSNGKISEIEAKYFTTFDYYKFTNKILETRKKEKGLIDKSSISNFVKNADWNTKLATVATKGELKAEQGQILKLQAFNSSYFSGKSHFEDEIQNYLLFQIVYRYFKKIANTNQISVCKSKGLSDESIKSPAVSNHSLGVTLNYIGTKSQVKMFI